MKIKDVKTLADFTKLSSGDRKKVMKKVVHSANEMQRAVMRNSPGYATKSG